MTYKTKVTTKAKSGPKPRVTAVRKLVLIEKSTVEFMRKLGDGRLGRGIDRAAEILNDWSQAELDSHQIAVGAVIHDMRDNTEPNPNDYD